MPFASSMGNKAPSNITSRPNSFFHRKDSPNPGIGTLRGGRNRERVLHDVVSLHVHVVAQSERLNGDDRRMLHFFLVQLCELVVDFPSQTEETPELEGQASNTDREASMVHPL